MENIFPATDPRSRLPRGTKADYAVLTLDVDFKQDRKGKSIRVTTRAARPANPGLRAPTQNRERARNERRS